MTAMEPEMISYGNKRGKLNPAYACGPGQDCPRMYAFTHRASKVDVSNHVACQVLRWFSRILRQAIIFFYRSGCATF